MNGSSETRPYRVLARTYRPSRFADLVGQDAAVRTLANAITSGRLAHAFILTGIRGVGKTTTARIIARALNCIGADGAGGPTPDPCGACDHCISIGEDRHIDVIEMDAASRTGVDDIRELIESVRYLPVSARFKIYIVDEVHMLSRSAFNALLKTLEEPPEHVKFVFATTEIRRVPVTVLSRCQRLDLRRVDGDTLFSHLETVAGREGVEIAGDALRQIVRAADGSVRDALSLLDQTIVHAAGGRIDGNQVRDMLGLADRMQIADLLEALMRGQAASALAVFDALYGAGADPIAVLQDLLEFVHWLTRLKTVPGDARAGGAVSDIELERGRALAAGLSIPILTRCWQIALKGVSETHMAANPRQTAEMVLIRLAYAADLPTPAEIVRAAEGGAPAAPARVAPPLPAPQPPQTAQPPSPAQPMPETAPPPETAQPMPENFEALVALFRSRKEVVLGAHLANDVGLVAYAPGRLRYRRGPHAPAGLENRLRRMLDDWTGERWSVEAVDRDDAAPSLSQQREAREAVERQQAIDHPAVQAALQMFPGATVEAVRNVEPAPILGETLPEPPAETEDDAEAEGPHGELPL